MRKRLRFFCLLLLYIPTLKREPILIKEDKVLFHSRALRPSASNASAISCIAPISQRNRQEAEGKRQNVSFI